MPLPEKNITANALAFSRRWAEAFAEKAQAQSFWNEFFQVFGVDRVSVGAEFEVRVPTIDGHGDIDLLWKGVLLVEHKSRSKNLDQAYIQALKYLPRLKESNLPRYILVCDFAHFRLHDLKENARVDFALENLHKNVARFHFISGYEPQKLREQDPVNIKAAERMGKLHDELRKSGYTGHQLEVYLVRLLFCLFADNTRIFNPQQFQFYLEERTAKDGADLGLHLNRLFDVLNTPAEKRSTNLDEQLKNFEYINGELFAENLLSADFNATMRKQLLDCCALDWSGISPAIFGSLFQSIMDKDARRKLGAHYTSEKNILKLINPLFMDALRAEFESAKRSKPKLHAFHAKLAALKFLDPACGCGNFLVIAYRELRMLELDVLRALHGKGKQAPDIDHLLQVNVDQFFGIELEEFPAQIARTAMWLVDHQMNELASREFGAYFARIPLTTVANIAHGNALRMEWAEVAPRMDYIMGNPPFAGRQHQTAAQKEDLLACFRGAKFAARMDFVTAWYCKAVDYIGGGKAKVAFVSTNSIAQGEFVAPLWNELRARHAMHIHFAHRTFNWSNKARGNAKVHCVIIGFGAQEAKVKRLFEYESVNGEAHEIKAQNINPYLVDAPDAFVENRPEPLCAVPQMQFGSMPNDGGHFSMSEQEKNELIAAEPLAEKWIRPFVMAHEYINGIPRFCLWLKDCPPNELRKMPLVMKRVQAVKEVRAKSVNKAAREFAAKPTLFFSDRQPTSTYLVVPSVSSERRVYIPIGYLPPDHITGNAMQMVPHATPFHFGVLTSAMHMAWMRAVGGRLKSDYRYSIRVVYNNFIWPENPTDAQTHAIESAAQAVLDARAKFPDATFADIYDPDSMPPALLRAHQKLDTAVDRAYRKQPFQNESARVAFLFDLYRQHTAPVMPAERKKRKRARGG